MAAPISLASICDSLVKAVRADLSLEFQARISPVIGSPQQIDAIDPRNDHYLNFFFYQFEPFEFDSDNLPGEPLLLRTRCLITPFAIQESEEAGAGFNDLKLIGEVIRIFHETPVRMLTVMDANEKPVDYHVQTIFHALGTEQINHLWTTQGGEVAYHPSVAYELALTPVLPRRPDPGSPLVGEVGFDVHAHTDSVPGHSGIFQLPRVAARSVATQREDWVPAVCWVHAGVCAESLRFPLGSAELAGFAPVVWVAGAPGTEVRFVWEVWRSIGGWTEVAATQTDVVRSSRIDPDDIDADTLSILDVPEIDGEPLWAHAGQVVLHASRTYVRASDQATLQVRSNPVLLSVFEMGSPP